MIQKLYYKFLKKKIILYIIYSICNINIVLEKIGLPHYYGKIISSLEKNNFSNIKTNFLYLIIIWITIQIAVIGQSYIQSQLYPQFIGYVRTNLIHKVIDNYKNDYIDLQTGKMLTKIIDSPYLLYDTARNISDFLVRNFITFISTFGYLLYYNYTIGLVFIISILLIFVVSYMYNEACKTMVRTSEALYVNVYEEIEDTTSNLLSIYTNNKTNIEKNRISKISKKADDADIKLYKCNTYYRAIYSIVFILIFIILNYFTFSLYFNKKIPTSILISIVIINYNILTDFLSIYWDVRYYIDNKERLDMLNKYINEMPKPTLITKLKTVKTNKLFNTSKYINVQFKNVNFGYKNKKVFKNFNLKINQKDKIAIIGEIGSGKSTIGKLIIGLKKIQGGQILINNVNLNSLNIDKLRNHITYIPQHPKLFNRTLYDNITYGLEKQKIDVNKIYNILDKNCLEDIKSIFKEKMFKKVGKNGSDLSGGQRQIVWIIRAILKKNKMIILDEPTSSLDEINKSKVMKLINNLSKNINIILITHDKSIIGNMNRIIKLKNGKILDDRYIN